MTRILCIHSLTAHGTVGLKPFITVLDGACLPVPSTLLTGPGDMPGCARFEYDFAAMLDGTLAAVAAKGERVVLFVGYLGNATQVAIVSATLAKYRSAIAVVVIDPVSGDHGRAYVSSELIAAWPTLLAEADWALPNVTEAALFSGVAGEPAAAVAALRERFPCLQLLVTGWDEGDERIGVRCFTSEGETRHAHRRIDRRFNGTGDLFAAIWVRRLFVQQTGLAEAIERAAAGVLAAIEAAQESGSADLVAMRR